MGGRGGSSGNGQGLNKYGKKVKYNMPNLSADNARNIHQTINKLLDEYTSSLSDVYYEKSQNYVGEQGSVDQFTGRTMTLYTSNTDTVAHEFFHTLDASSREKKGFETNKEFWKESKKLFSEYKKEANRPGGYDVRISQYSLTKVDEFMAEAFAVSKGKTGIGADKSGVGKKSPYVTKAMAIIDKHFKRR